ncbi:hypothetical protein [Roseococcus sp. YIM B11640]|uniref:hypothetical protein n=1 Tax=Roseococcus sp. YIM B11640 TaxID=3133973 RepID=UPI003C7C7166
MSDHLQERFRLGLLEEMDRRWERCSLVEWLSAHHAEAVEVLNHGRMDWGHAAKLFARQGLRDGLGREPTAETAREAWRRVEERRRAGMRIRSPR